MCVYNDLLPHALIPCSLFQLSCVYMIAYCIITSTGRHKKWGMLAAGWESWHYVTQGNVCIAALSQTSLKGGSEVSTSLIFRATFLGGVKSVLLLCVGIDQKASDHPPDPQILSLESPPLFPEQPASRSPLMGVSVCPVFHTFRPRRSFRENETWPPFPYEKGCFGTMCHTCFFDDLCL